MLPDRFDLSYIDGDGKKKRPVVIHRAIFGSFERFLGILLEHTAGDLPVWLAPVQVRILPIAERHEEKAKAARDALVKGGVRAEISGATETLGKRIRDAELMKIPYIAVLGDKEAEIELTVRKRGKPEQRTVPLEILIRAILEQAPDK